jgi:hypothetical protein
MIARIPARDSWIAAETMLGIASLIIARSYATAIRRFAKGPLHQTPFPTT